MNWYLIVVLGFLAVLITCLMRPDIFLAALRGGGERANRPTYRPKTDEEFQADLKRDLRSKDDVE